MRPPKPGTVLHVRGKQTVFGLAPHGGAWTLWDGAAVIVITFELTSVAWFEVMTADGRLGHIQFAPWLFELLPEGVVCPSDFLS